MTTVTKECRFDAAHLLTNHNGQCKNLHGHTYRVLVKVAGEGDGDMVMDFKDLKDCIGKLIIDRFDHAFIYNTRSEAESEIAGVIERHGLKSVGLPFRSTAENLARYFFDEISSKIKVASVQVYETPDSCAEYSRD